METPVLVAAWLFALTHIDTLVVLVAFCANDRYRLWEIVAGHYLGFGLGLLGALFVSLLAAEVFQPWTFLLGVVPLALGVWGLLRRRPDVEIPEPMDVPSPIDRIGVVTAAGVGLSGENIAVFVPFFVTLTTGELLVVLALYLVGAGVLFVVAFLVAHRSVVGGLPPWLEEWLVPAALVAVGLYVLGAGWLAA